MKKKNILIFIDWFTPGYRAGGPITSNANMIAWLCNDYHFFVVTRNTDYMDNNPYQGIKANEWTSRENGSSVYYVSADQLNYRNLIRISESVPYDFIFVNGIYSRYFSLFPVLWFSWIKRKKVVVSARGMLSDQTFTAKKTPKKVFFLLTRLCRFYKGVIIHATNAHEKEQIIKNTGFKGDIQIAPNFPPAHKMMEFQAIRKVSGELKLVSVARISAEKNTLGALKFVKQLADYLVTMEEVDDFQVTFDLFGPVYQDGYAAECATLSESMPSQVQVRFCGPLEKEKVPGTLKDYHFLLMPSQGENYGHAIVESFLAGRPVIISDRTPWKNLQHVKELLLSGTPDSDAGVGWEIALDDEEKFIQVLSEAVLMSQEKYSVLSQNAYTYGRLITHDDSIKKAYHRLFGDPTEENQSC